MEQLVRMPALGHQRSDASDRYRFWRVGHYLIAYRVENDIVHVARVLHGRETFGGFSDEVHASAFNEFASVVETKRCGE